MYILSRFGESNRKALLNELRIAYRQSSEGKMLPDTEHLFVVYLPLTMLIIIAKITLFPAVRTTNFTL